jgi:Uma2 family endonuclease
MADPGDKKKRATYQDVLDAPEHMVAELIDGELRLSPRPAPPHALALSALGYALGPPFHHGDGGPGGWVILHEPELHLGPEIVVPDLAGWRRERFDARWLRDAHFTAAPDWLCEVLSPRTAVNDRLEKLPIYARAGVRNVWLLHPIYRSLEVFRLEAGKWVSIATHVGNAMVRAEPFDAIELDLARLWRDVPPPASRASDMSDLYARWAELL